MRLLLGLIKGLIIGGLLGFGAYELGLGEGWNWVVYGAIGACVGLLVGRPIWSHLFDKESTVVVAVLKGLVGFGVGVGLYALVAKVWGGMDLAIAPLDDSRNFYNWQFLMGGSIGAIYGAWVELDDAPSKAAAASASASGSDAAS